MNLSELTNKIYAEGVEKGNAEARYGLKTRRYAQKYFRARRRRRYL